MIIESAIYDGFYQSAALPLSAQSCVNWFPKNNMNSNGETMGLSLLGTAGITQLATTGTINQANRGSWTFKDKAYFVNGTGLYRLESDLVTMTSLGTITGTGRVSIADNGTQMLILVPNSTGYIFTTGPDNLATITDPDFTTNGNPQAVKFMDGYFVLTTDTKKFIVSALNDGTSYNALDFGTAEYNPDGTVAPFVHKSTLFIFGTETGEAFSNIGGVSFPFQRQTGFVLSKGLFSADSIVASQDTFMFIGGGKNEGPAVWMLSGNTTQKISTEAIDCLLDEEAKAGLLPDVFAYAYSQDGSYFVCWSLNDTTIVYDSSTQKWHERKSIIDNVVTSWRVNSVTTAYGRLLVGDSIDGRIGACDVHTLTEYGEVMERTIAGRPFTNQGLPFTIPYIEVTMESGVGNSDSPDPKIRMDRSKNGKTWSDERIRSVGKVGEYDHRIAWRRNGMANRNEIFRFKYAEKAKAVILKVEAQVVPMGMANA